MPIEQQLRGKAVSPSIYNRSVLDWPVGVTVYYPEKCFNGYTLFCPLASPIIYLIDMRGEVVHMWFIAEGKTTPHIKYVGKGHIIYASDWLTEVDWKGNVVWHYCPPGGETDPHGGAGSIAWDPSYKVQTAHHDFQRLENGNTLILASERINEPSISDCQLMSDYFIEVTPQSKPVWIWHSHEHFDEFGFDKEAKPLIRKEPGVHMNLAKGDYLHTNTVEVLPDTPLGRQDERFRKGNILSSQRNTNTIYIIDKDTGKVVWHWGPGELVGQHHPNMLASGNILIYDNGGVGGYPRKVRAHTRLIEVNPISEKIVWQYVHEPLSYYHDKFSSWYWGSVQQLPNGNTLSLDANKGRLFEITADGEIVWEYVNGYRGQFWYNGRIRMETGVYRCYRIGYDEVPDFSKDFTVRDKWAAG